MKFLIEYTNEIEQKSLIYDFDDQSFDTIPSVQFMNFDIVINRLNLTTVGGDNKISQIWGFSENKKWIKSNCVVPVSQKGILKVLDNLEGGMAYRLSKTDLSSYVNIQSGWVCFGDPNGRGNAVEFIDHCIAVIDDENEFISLWLKPEKLPNLL